MALPAITRRMAAPWVVRNRIIASTRLPVADIVGLFRRRRRIATINLLMTATTGIAAQDS
jgi:hypothetical protein